MLSKTQIFEKKGTLSSEKKRFWPNFSRIIEYDKPQGTIYIHTGPQGFLASTVEVIRSIL